MNVVVTPGRIGRFVKAARSLLLVQVLAALLALGIAIWAVVEVRAMAVERDRLRARVAELEAQQAAAPATGAAPLLPPGPGPLLNEVAPYDLPPEATLPPTLPDANVIAPTAPPVAAPPANQQQPAEETGPPRNPRWDCSGANARLPRCQPLMERPTVPLNGLTPRGAPLGPTPGGNQQGPG